MQRIPQATVLECMRFVEKTKAEHRRTVQNYEFDLYLHGEREIVLDGKPYHVERGSLIFRKPKQYTVGKGDYDMFLLTLDFSGNMEKNKKHRSPFGEPQPIFDFDELNEIPSVFVPDHFDELEDLFERLSKCSPPAVVDKERQKECVKEFLLLVLYEAKKARRNTDEPGRLNGYVQKACEFIAAHYGDDLGVETLAKRLNLNKNYLIKLFKKHLSTTPNQYILETRLLRAKILLLQTNQSVQEIAFSCGFNVPSYFTKRFKARFGCLPLEFRKQNV